MYFKIYNQVLVSSLVLLISCYSSQKTDDSRDSDAGVPLVDSGDQSADAGGSLDKGMNASTLVGTWEGELMYYGSDGTLTTVIPTTVEFTDTTMDVTIGEISIRYLYSLDTDRAPQYLDAELFDPERTLSFPYVIPVFYKIEDDILTLGLSFYPSPLQTPDVEEEFFSMLFKVERVM